MTHHPPAHTRANRLQANRQQLLKWLNQNVLDPNDPRNAPLLELMRAHEATSGGMGDLFRLDVFPDVAIEEDRMQVGAGGQPHWRLGTILGAGSLGYRSHLGVCLSRSMSTHTQYQGS